MAQAIQTARPEFRAIAQGNVRGSVHQGWITGLLLGLMLLSVTASVATANWTDGLWAASWAALGGMLFAALVARLRLNGLLALALAGLVGAAWVALLSGDQVAPAGATWNEKLILIEDRLDQWLVLVLRGGVAADAFIFLLFCNALAWLIGYIGGWSLFRHHQPWGAILPAGTALLVNLFYAPPQSGLFLMVFVLVGLLLLVRTTLLKRQQAWAEAAVRYASDIGLDFLTYGVIFSGLIILIAWIVPPTAPGPAWFGFILETLREPWQAFQQDVTRAFSTVRAPSSGAPTTFFSHSLTMGGPIRLGTRPVFEIDSPAGRYWRVVVFDKYTGTGWVSMADETASFVANDPRLVTPPSRLRRIITQTVEILLPTDNLVVAASQPLQVSEAVTARFSVMRVDADQVFFDLHALRLQKPPREGTQYTVISSLSNADEDSLRLATPSYPEYIKQQYLSLPATLPPRVRELAQQITAGATNNYDKARAIEQYLRARIKYNEGVEPIPLGRDGVDYLLFDRPEGYCNYYASAMAVLARSIGIPARVASGYSVGRSEDGLFHINESNAHSWPELYFGELGWIEFEPTAGQPEIVRPQRQDDGASDALGLNAEDEDVRPPRDRELDEKLEELRNRDLTTPESNALLNVGMGASIAVLLLIVGGGGVFWVVQWNWRRKMQVLPPAAREMAEMYRWAALAGFRERTQATPFERAAALAQLLPDARAAIYAITASYERERYGAYTLSPREQAEIYAQGKFVRRRMWRGIYDYWIGRALSALL